MWYTFYPALRCNLRESHMEAEARGEGNISPSRFLERNICHRIIAGPVGQYTWQLNSSEHLVLLETPWTSPLSGFELLQSFASNPVRVIFTVFHIHVGSSPDLLWNAYNIPLKSGIENYGHFWWSNHLYTVHIICFSVFTAFTSKDLKMYLRLIRSIRKTYLYYFDPLKPHVYIVKVGFTGVYIIFLISAQNIDCGYSLELPRRSGSD